MRRILILTAGFGEGHNAAARNLADAIRLAEANASVWVEDIFATAYGPINRLAQYGYLTLINRCPALWSHAFKWLDRTSMIRSQIGVFGRAAKLARRRLGDLNPDVIVSTYPGYNHLLDTLYRGSPQRPYTMVTIVTDSITVNSVWFTAHSDWYLVANTETEAVMLNRGVPSEHIRVTGFPVPDRFVDLKIKHVAPKSGQPWKILFMVNSGKFIAVEILNRLMELEDVEITVTVGRDDALQKRLECAATNAGKQIEVLGWTDQLPRLIATSHVVVTKAGGATVQECLAAGTPMVVSQVVPGQEEGNAQLITKAGAGIIAITPDAIHEGLSAAFADQGKQWKQWDKAADQLSRPGASRHIADWILAMEPPTSQP